MSIRLGWHDAREVAEAAGAPLPPETVALADSIGRRLARDLVSPTDLPHFASSAMDGWLVVGEGPWEITDGEPGPGQARAVVTGGSISEEITAVLRSELAAVEGGTVRSVESGAPRPGQHIRPVGAEARRGETLISSGSVLNPAHVALAASAGIDAFEVQAIPEVALVLTGDEVVTSGTPAGGQVRDSFGVQLPALFGLLGARVSHAARVGDQLDRIVEAIAATSAPLIVTTGGTGRSSADHLRDALAVLNARILLDGIAMRPGAPTLLAELPDGRLIACLPGNPLAAMVVALTICEPLIAGLAGRRMRPTRTVDGADLPGRPGSTILVPFSAEENGLGVSPWVGAGMMRGLADADGLLVVPGGGIFSGRPAESVDLPWRAPATR